MKIPPKDYPANRLWDEKVFSMPNIPRGSIGMLAVLRDILERVKRHNNPRDILAYEGSDSKITLDEACVRLRPMHLVSKSENGWVLSKESMIWLESGDDLYLAAFLCANIRFLAEVLFYLDTPRKSTELKEIALREYGLGWKTISDINSRLVWLRQFSLVEFQEFSLQYSITDLGKEFLQNVPVVEPNQIAHKEDVTEGEEILEVEPWAVAYCDIESQQLSMRKQSIGYVPGNITDFDKTIIEYLNLVQVGTNYEAIRRYAKENYNIAPSSLKSFMSTLTNMGLIQRQTDELYVLTKIADEWMNHCSKIELIYCIHRNFMYVFELLNELNEQPRTYQELAAIGKVSYGMDKASIEEIRKRVNIFKSAKLVRNASLDKFTITKRGKLLLIQTVFQKRRLTDTIENSEKSICLNQNESLFTELRLSSRDSMNPDRFEWAIKAAFEALGFKAIKLGGSGKTDVLIHAPGSPKNSFSVAVDAKSTASGSVSDSLVDFDTLEEHRKKHDANYSMIVGCAFQNERLIKRAVEHKVLLLDVEQLETLIKRHLNVPIKTSSYRQIFDKAGIADISFIEGDRQKIVEFGRLIKDVMSCLISESEDPITEGFLFERDIYRSLRDRQNIIKLPTIEEISNILQFLSSPIIGCVEKTKDGYYATGSLPDVAHKFAFYSQSCSEDK